MTVAIYSPAESYARAVTEGEILAGRLVRLACERHLRDLEQQGTDEFPYYFDPDSEAKAIRFFAEVLTLTEGDHADEPFVLQPWQEFVVGNIFGWKSIEDDARRFRTAYLEIGKGNGKSPMAGGIGLYCLTADGEEGAEIYAAAVTRDQAKIAFRDAFHMVEASPALRKRLELLTNNISFNKRKSFFRPVSSESRGLDGLRVHCAVIDEIHEHRTDLVVNKIRAGTKGRRQALIFEITNSGFDRESICYRHHMQSEQILTGVLRNESWFAYVCGLDPCESCAAQGHTQPQENCAECDDWRDEGVWIKANPNLDVSITRRYLREQAEEGEQIPTSANIIKRLNFCIWTQSVTRWLPVDAWELGSVPPPNDLAGRDCFAGIDLSSTSDLSALSLFFPDVRGGGDVLSFAWCPEDTVLERTRTDAVPYDYWANEGYLTPTPGNTVDTDFIRATLNELRERYRILAIAIDPWNASTLMTQLQADGFEVYPIRQGFASLTAPSKELEKMVRSGTLRHGGNPILRWAANNVVVVHDAAENIKPTKEKSTERIDPIVALINALSRYVAGQEPPKPSVYEERGLRRL